MKSFATEQQARECIQRKLSGVCLDGIPLYYLSGSVCFGGNEDSPYEYPQGLSAAMPIRNDDGSWAVRVYRFKKAALEATYGSNYGQDGKPLA